MQVPSLSVFGFRRFDMGERGAAFLRFEVPETDTRKAEVREESSYCYSEFKSYTVRVPLPRTPVVTGIVIIERTSKSRYSVSACGRDRNGENKIVNFSVANRMEIIGGVEWLWRKDR